MTLVSKPLTNRAYGFPRGKPRRIKPVALACVHITGNRKTAQYADPRKAARAEWSYANRAGSDGPSAHVYGARDGWGILAIDWRRFAAWSNGDVLEPNRDNPGIRRVLAMKAKGYNANEAYWLEFEFVGFGDRWPITDDQVGLAAALIAEAAIHSGLAISRETVHGHWEINGVNRANCPATSKREAFLQGVVDRARALMPSEDPMSLYVPDPRGGGTFTIPARTEVDGFEPAADGWRVAKTLPKADRPETAGFDHAVRRVGAGGPPTFLLHVASGPLEGLYVNTAQVEERFAPDETVAALEKRLAIANDRLSRIDQLAEPV